jgi:hypothetical protein
MIRSGMIKFGVMALGALLTGCVTDDGAAARAALIAQKDTAETACKSHYSPATPQNIVAFTQCLNQAHQETDAVLPDDVDILARMRADDVLIAMRVQNGELTVQQGIALMDRRSADALTEMKNRQFAIHQAYQAAQRPPTVNCRTWSDGAGIATQVYTSCQ